LIKQYSGKLGEGMGTKAMVDLKQIPTRVLLAMAISMYFKIMVRKIKNKFRGRIYEKVS